MKILLAAGLALVGVCSATAQLVAVGSAGATASVSSNGAWSLNVPGPGWQFGGSVNSTVRSLRNNQGVDELGLFEEIAFDYTVASAPRSASIRVYPSRSVALFLVTCNTDCNNTAHFPAFTTYPSIFHLSYDNEFAEPNFNNLIGDSPWVFFDSAANSFILSAGSDFMTSSQAKNSTTNAITSGISTQIAKLPAGFTHRTVLAFGSGINATFENWGNAITSLTGKRRPSNDADPLLKSISYWTDNGATYYYNPGGPSYMDTLDSVKAEFDSKGIRLGTLQLDSWWYPKGPDNSWSSHSGIWTYEASPALFPSGLPAFQQTLATPLITHARWIDSASPYRGQYTISGNVATDPKYWEDIGDTLKAGGVAVYEQDWLGDEAHSDFNLYDPSAFLGNMAASMAKRGIAIQYCMATPKHFMESARYGNVTSIRTSQDRFGSGRFTHFFYSSRFAAAVGAWPFSDVFMSNESHNLIAATLSAGPLGVGDPMGKLAAGNLLKAVRSDGVIVKPDVPATPLDSVYVNDAQKIDSPMVASTYSDYGAGLRATYLVAYPRGANTSWIVQPADFGIAGSAYLYDALNGTGTLIDAQSNSSADISSGFQYRVLVPVGASGIAFLGDKGHYVTLGRKRVAAFTDDGAVAATVLFADGEQTRTLFGYSPSAVAVTSITGTHAAASWDPTTQLFTVKIHPASDGSARVRIVQRAVPTACTIRCAAARQ